MSKIRERLSRVRDGFSNFGHSTSEIISDLVEGASYGVGTANAALEAIPVVGRLVEISTGAAIEGLHHGNHAGREYWAGRAAVRAEREVAFTESDKTQEEAGTQEQPFDAAAAGAPPVSEVVPSWKGKSWAKMNADERKEYKKHQSNEETVRRAEAAKKAAAGDPSLMPA